MAKVKASASESGDEPGVKEHLPSQDNVFGVQEEAGKPPVAREGEEIIDPPPEPLPPERPPAQELYQPPAYDLNAEARKINEAAYASLTAAGLDYASGRHLLERAKATLGALWVEKRDEVFRAQAKADAKAGVAETPQEAAGKSHDTTVIPAARSA